MKIVIKVYDVTGLLTTSDVEELDYTTAERTTNQLDAAFEDVSKAEYFNISVKGVKKHYNPSNIVSIWWEEVE
ncbi:hypothetical protein [Sinomicrobium sp.]